MENHDQQPAFKGMPVFKSMRRFRHRNREEQLADARKSPYFWWWSYLRLSKDYWWLCQRSTQICQDERLRKMRRDFGDVYSMQFDEWWLEHGCHLFAEQIALPSVRQIDLRKLDISPNTDDHIVVEIPLRLTESPLQNSFSSHHPTLTDSVRVEADGDCKPEDQCDKRKKSLDSQAGHRPHQPAQVIACRTEDRVQGIAN